MRPSQSPGPDSPLVDTEVGPEGLDLLTPAHKLRQTREGRTLLTLSGRGHDSHERRRARSADQRRETKWDRAEFVAWDGEGVDVAGRHRYVILANSLGDSAVNPDGITTRQAFDMMLRASAKASKAVHVIFAGGYDVNMILKGTLTRSQARRLSDNGRITVHLDEDRYAIRYHPRHEFGVARVEWDDKAQTLRRLGKITLWDVFGSFQCSFVAACQKLLPEKDLAELEHIADMKGKRAVFRLSDIPDMLEYCRAELRALVRLAEVDRDNFNAAGFKAARFDGAGAKASAVFRARGLYRHKAETPPELQKPTRGAYAGGRIESYRFGYYRGPIWTVDIRSAYPWAATFLPTLSGGTWETVTSPEGRNISPNEFSVWHVQYEARSLNRIQPLFWRGPSGAVAYPAVTSGWYWAPEVAAARTMGGGRLRIDRGYVFHPETDEKPFAFIPDLFRIRAALERNRKGQGVALKFALNSMYGKLAQQIGSKNGKPPRWHQLEWAGWITSKTRATVYRMAVERQDNLVDIATDGVCFYGSTPDAKLLSRAGDNLGNLEIATYDEGVWVQSGIYWLHDADGWIQPKVRGIGLPDPCKICRAGPDTACEHRSPLARERFLTEWGRRSFGTVPVDVTRFRGMVTSSLSDERWTEWCQWVRETRDITAGARGKRAHIPEDCSYCRATLRGSPVDGSGLHSTLPVGGGSESALHILDWETKVGRATADNEAWLDTLDEDDSEAE